MANVLDKEMFNYFTRLNEAEKKSVVQMLKTFLKGREEISNRISIEQYNKEIDEAMEEIKRGEVYTHEEVVKMAKKSLEISNAVLVEPFVLKVFFNNLQDRIIDFRPFFNTLKGDYKKYNTTAAFKKFMIKNGELWWGKNADIQFHPIDVYYNSLLHPLHDEFAEDLVVL